MELRHLRYFVEVADALNFTRAARRLRVAQPALSRQVRQLEEEIGVMLLVRDRHGVRLTASGAAFLAEARSILSRSEEAIRSARTVADVRGGTLRLGYVWGLFHSRVPAVIEDFRARHPGVAVHLFDFTATQQAAALRDGTLDAGFIGFAREADDASLSRRRVGSCSLVAALPAGHPAARRRELDVRVLRAEMFLAISEATYPGAAHLVDEACVRAGFKPRIVQVAERGHTLLALVSARCGVALVPEPLRGLPHAGVVFRELKDPPTADLYVAWDAAAESPARDAFLAGLDDGGRKP